jgi:hypothetical protein
MPHGKQLICASEQHKETKRIKIIQKTAIGVDKLF